MKLALIAAHDPNLVIGNNGELPWHYREDMLYFKKTTMGHTVIMGRGVFEEIGEKPLSGRKNIVLTTTRQYDTVITCTSIKEALNKINQDDNRVFVIGGGEIYRQTIDMADELFITEIHQEYEGDTFFPEYRDQINNTWNEVWREDKQEYSFVKFERKPVKD